MCQSEVYQFTSSDEVVIKVFSVIVTVVRAWIREVTDSDSKIRVGSSSKKQLPYVCVGFYQENYFFNIRHKEFEHNACRW